MKNIIITLIIFYSTLNLYAQDTNRADASEPIEHLLRSPDDVRSATGSPGNAYWQQQVDYDMAVTLNGTDQTMTGDATITYNNQSPDALDYIWLELYQNAIYKDSDAFCRPHTPLQDNIDSEALDNILLFDFEGGYTIIEVTDIEGKNLPYEIHKTNMVIDITAGIPSKGTYIFNIKWSVKIPNVQLAHSGFEYFEEDDNYIYAFAQFYPRVHYYSDYDGWHHKPYLGSGEFISHFGNYEVALTVPDNMIVHATGNLQNEKEVLSKRHLKRLEKARQSDKPIFIVTPEEAASNEKVKATKNKTYRYTANNVRDFAFAASPKFIWEAKKVSNQGKAVLAMSLYPKEARGIWESKAVELTAHTIESFSSYLQFPYPYDNVSTVNISFSAMEYPMMGLVDGRAKIGEEKSQEYVNQILETIVHEVGHNYFPMLVNSDERKWMWMDEGLNTFLMERAIHEYDPTWKTLAGNMDVLPNYLASGPKENFSPIMTEADNLQNTLLDAYGKPSIALRILRQSVMGEKLFDRAFRTYVKKWAYRNPTPEDFFRTMEDASGLDLDWFWKAWFFNQTHLDISLSKVRLASTGEKSDIMVNVENMRADQKERLAQKPYLYEMTFENVGGTVSPIHLLFHYEDGSDEQVTMPVEIWRYDSQQFSRVFPLSKKLKGITIDKDNKTGDINKENNVWKT